MLVLWWLDMTVVRFHCPFVGLNSCQDSGENGLIKTSLITHLRDRHCSGDAQAITKQYLSTNLVVFEEAEVTFKRMGIWLCEVCFKTHTLRSKCRHGNGSDFVSPSDCGDDVVSLLSKGLHIIKSIPLECCLGFSHVLKGALDKVICTPHDIFCWVSLLVFPLGILKTFFPCSNIECRFAIKRKHQEESIVNAIRSWSVPGGVAPYNHATLDDLKTKYPFKPAPSLPDIPIDSHHLIAPPIIVIDMLNIFLRGTSSARDGLSAQHLMDCMSGAAIVSSITQVVNLFLDRKCLKVSVVMISHSLNDYLDDLQFDVGVSGGSEAILHVVNRLIEDRGDDGTTIGDTLVVGKVLELSMKDGYRCGLHLNVGKTEVFWLKEDPRSRLAGIFSPNIPWPLHDVKLLGGPVSVDINFSSELIMKRVAKTIKLMNAVAKINYPQSQHSFDMALRSSLERIVTASRPRFGTDYERKFIETMQYRVLALLVLNIAIMLCVIPLYHSEISAGKEVDTGLDRGRDKPLRPTDMLFYLWDGGLYVCVDVTGSSPLTQTEMADFVPDRAVIDAAHRKRIKYETKCAGIGYGFLSFSFSSLRELEEGAITLLKRIRKFFMTQDIGHASIHIFNGIGFAIAKKVLPDFRISISLTKRSLEFRKGDVYFAVLPYLNLPTTLKQALIIECQAYFCRVDFEDSPEPRVVVPSLETILSINKEPVKRSPEAEAPGTPSDGQPFGCTIRHVPCRIRPMKSARKARELRFKAIDPSSFLFAFRTDNEGLIGSESEMKPIILSSSRLNNVSHRWHPFVEAYFCRVDLEDSREPRVVVPSPETILSINKEPVRRSPEAEASETPSECQIAEKQRKQKKNPTTNSERDATHFHEEVSGSVEAAKTFIASLSMNKYANLAKQRVVAPNVSRILPFEEGCERHEALVDSNASKKSRLQQYEEANERSRQFFDTSATKKNQSRVKVTMGELLLNTKGSQKQRGVLTKNATKPNSATTSISSGSRRKLIDEDEDDLRYPADEEFVDDNDENENIEEFENNNNEDEFENEDAELEIL
uniref:Transposase, Ptta/En/Spm n=1 Tax=Tanacetum cinerariifolium TaxID=118510 RepID=A0A6L2N7M1_TANCI|nr:transposase, Ptta/En/Spm [Tanacetum cinerariifolium]